MFNGCFTHRIDHSLSLGQADAPVTTLRLLDCKQRLIRGREYSSVSYRLRHTLHFHPVKDTPNDLVNLVFLQ
jgi:hypothetical protein